jgi:hypothetical protein
LSNVELPYIKPCNDYLFLFALFYFEHVRAIMSGNFTINFHRYHFVITFSICRKSYDDRRKCGPYIYPRIPQNTQQYPRISQNTQEYPRIPPYYPGRTAFSAIIIWFSTNTDFNLVSTFHLICNFSHMYIYIY